MYTHTPNVFKMTLIHTNVIGIINDINGTKYSYFSFLHTLCIWQKTACDTQIAS